MKKLMIAAVLMGSVAAHAVPLIVVDTTVAGPSTGDLGLLTDGAFPTEGGGWQIDTVWWSGTGTTITFDLGMDYLVRDIALSVDNNDSYLVQASTDGVNWSPLFDVAIGDGEIGWGMDTMTSDALMSAYVPSLEFAATTARFLSIAAMGGDDSYSVGEFQVFGDEIGGSSPVPAPATALLLAAGLGALGATRSKRAKR